jgi:signal transduction histidine kinase
MSELVRLLLIDDNPDDRKLARRSLTRALPELEVEEIGGPEALASTLAGGDYGIVITDYSMGWTNGIEVLREFKRRSPDTPVIMFTNTGTEEICAQAMKEGLADYILKRPEYYSRLPAAVRTALEVREARRALAAKEEELLQALEREREASRLKDEFLSTLSHELRTPLNAIMGWTQLFRAGRRSEQDLERGLEVIDRNVRLQTQLIEDLLDISRIISGKIRLDVQQVDLIPVLEAALDSVQGAIEAKGLRLQKVLDPLAGPVLGDPTRLQQIIWNLLSNAIKFTPEGGRIRVTLERVDSHVEIAVSDNGEGIAPEFLPYVFDRLRQADSSTTRRHGGMGLGLSIVKHLTELQGGTVWARSPGVGRGASFSVLLPVAVLYTREGRPEPAALHEEPPSEPFAPVSLAGLRVLVVDDEPDALEVLKQFLEDCQAEVLTARSAAEAFALFQQQRPDVLVSDIGMPHEDGYQLISRIRRLEADSEEWIPAVALTAFARAEDRRRALLAGYQVHVSKPVEATELTATIASLVGRTGRA